ncbi:hypothetical protein B0H13DRAFT_2410476 [Mycena leptocephala]|nr:hypothetical protein B0H13DRAFT_2357573 [Mycena leptocephala]KAJ7922481.1 hypothetical protein B0H13DRAFT_2410476 [Mycena leptocephala]
MSASAVKAWFSPSTRTGFCQIIRCLPSQRGGNRSSFYSHRGPVAASSGAAILVLVGANNQLTFSPSNITANVGDTVTFQFESKNHVQRHPIQLRLPCTPLTPGVDSGFVPVTPNAANVPEFSFTINNASTLSFSFPSRRFQSTSAIKGWSFPSNANPDSSKSFAAFQANAEATAPPSAKVQKQAPRGHPRDFSSAAKIARK